MAESIRDRWITMVRHPRRTVAIGEKMMQMLVALDRGSTCPSISTRTSRLPTCCAGGYDSRRQVCRTKLVAGQSLWIPGGTHPLRRQH